MAVRDAPVPDDPHRVQFLLDRLRSDLPTPPVLLGALVGLALEIGQPEGLGDRLGTKDAKEVLAVEAFGRDRVRLFGPFGERFPVKGEQVVEGQRLLDEGFVIPPPVRQDEVARLGVWRHFESALLQQPDDVLNTAQDALGYSFIPSLDRPLELTSTVVETDAKATRRLIKFQKRHDVQPPARAGPTSPRIVAPRVGDSHQCRPQASPRFRQISVRKTTRGCVNLTQPLVVPNSCESGRYRT